MRGGKGGGGARAKDRYGLMDPRARMAGKAKDRSLMVEGGDPHRVAQQYARAKGVEASNVGPHARRAEKGAIGPARVKGRKEVRAHERRGCSARQIRCGSLAQGIHAHERQAGSP